VRIEPGTIIAVLIILFVSFPVHEFSHALAAYRLGDSTARMFGRLTLNPIVHFDPIGGVFLLISALLGVGIGWAKPTPVNPLNLRYGRWGEAIVAFAGPASNLLIAAAAALPLRYIIHSSLIASPTIGLGSLVFDTLDAFVAINLVLMIFNLVPIPPLDGSKVMFAFMNPRTVWQIRPTLEQYGFLILILFIAIPIGNQGSLISVIFRTFLEPIRDVLLGI
jgi:Zn-dependent protease